jgi:hypothetical protein
VEQASVVRRAAELREAAAAKRGAYERSRDGGVADVVVVGAAGACEGLTGDYLTVALGDRATPRGTRFAARLAYGDDGLVAVPLSTSP